MYAYVNCVLAQAHSPSMTTGTATGTGAGISRRHMDQGQAQAVGTWTGRRHMDQGHGPGAPRGGSSQGLPVAATRDAKREGEMVCPGCPFDRCKLCGLARCSPDLVARRLCRRKRCDRASTNTCLRDEDSDRSSRRRRDRSAAGFVFACETTFSTPTTGETY